jgi:hypothetical protein
MTLRAGKKKLLNKTLEAAREAASQVEDGKMRAGVLVALAVISNDPSDLRAINEVIGAMEKGSLRAEAVAAIAKKLAKFGKIIQARELVLSIPGSDNYWRAEACARIGLYSRDQLDFGNARRFASQINDPRRMEETLVDIDTYEYRPGSVREEDMRIEQRELVGLVTALARIGEFERAHELASGITVAHWRARAFASVATILAEGL